MIIHVDMDAFYASVEERECPELVGKPLIVGGTAQGRGVVAAANYAVRKFGVHSAMSTAKALRLCPHAILVSPRLRFYAEVSDQIRAILDRFTPLVEPLSLDEAFMDVTGCESLFGSAVEIGRRIKREIRESLRLVASVGVAPNKFLAKIASDLKKPDGFVVVEGDRVQEFLDPLPISRLWGVGSVTQHAMEGLGLRTIGQVRQSAVETLDQHFASNGRRIWELANGIDDRTVVSDREAKSVSHETTFPVDIQDREVLRAWVVELAEQVGWRLRRKNLRGKTVNLKVRFADFQTLVRSKSLPTRTNTTGDIWHVAVELLEACLATSHKSIRLLGVGMSGFEEGHERQGTLFDDGDLEKQRQLDQTSDQIRERFGAASLHRASGLLHNAEHKPMPRPHDKRE